MLACGLLLLGACGGGGGSDSAPGSYLSVVAADLDGDGRMDVAASHSGGGSPPHAGTVVVVLQDRSGTGGFLAPQRWPTGNDPVALTAGDFDRDGRIDLATYDAILATSGAGVEDVAVLLQTPAMPASFEPALSCFPTWLSGAQAGRGSPRCAALSLPGDFRQNDTVVVDVDGDGLPDEVTAHFGTISSPCAAFDCSVVGARVSVVLRDPAATGGVRRATDYPGSTFVAGVAVADIDGDGRPDLAIAETTGLFIRRQDPARPGMFLAPVRIDR